MGPRVGVPETVRRGLAPSRDVLCRAEGVDHGSRSVTGLLLSPQQTLPGVAAVQGGAPGAPRSRRAMHAAVWAAGWAADARRPPHRAGSAGAQCGRGRAGISLAWTSAHHERGRKMGGGHKAGEHGEQRMAPSQPVVTAGLANRARLDGMAGLVQQPHRQAEAMADGQETGRASSPELEAGRGRVVERLPHQGQRLGERKRTALALDIVPHLAHEGQVPQAHSALANGVLHRERRRGIARAGTPWGRELAGARPRQWQGPGQRGEAVAQALRQAQPESWRAMPGRCRPGETQPLWVLTTGVRRKR